MEVKATIKLTPDELMKIVSAGLNKNLFPGAIITKIESSGYPVDEWEIFVEYPAEHPPTAHGEGSDARR